MSYVKFTNGLTVTWPSLGLFRTWLIMLALSPLVSAPFISCWAAVTLARMFFAAVKSLKEKD